MNPKLKAKIEMVLSAITQTQELYMKKDISEERYSKLLEKNNEYIAMMMEGYIAGLNYQEETGTLENNIEE